jgi:two-component system chemotaxis response regulator CheY
MVMKILVADDSATMRKIIVRSLKAIGYNDTVEAADGDETIQVFQGGQIDIVLLDWNMPGKTAQEVVTELLALDHTLPIIMVTTQSQKNQVAFSVGIADFIVKPFTADTLREKIERRSRL